MAFFDACQRGDINLLRDVNLPSLLVAVLARDSDLLGDFRKSLIEKTDSQGNTALHVAVTMYSVDMVKQMLKLAAKLHLVNLCDCKNNMQETPLDIAIRLQFVEAVEVLIPCTKSALEGKHNSVLHLIVSLNQVKLLEILIKFSEKNRLDLSKHINLPYQPATKPTEKENCDTSPSDNEGNGAAYCEHIQPLHTAVRNIYEHLIKQDKRPTQPIVLGDMPLHTAASNKYERIVDLLLKVDGVNKHALNREGKTPVDIAREVMEYHESFRIIRKLGDFKRRVKPFMYCAPQVSYEKHKRAGDMINRAYEERRSAELVVAALLATMTFTAAFTVPGGFQTDTKQKHELGSPVLISFTSFRLFLTFDCIAFFLALFACIMCQMTSELTVGDKLLFMTINSGVVCCSFGFTAYGFMAALYTVLEHKVNALSWVVLGNLSFITLCGIFACIYQSARFAVSRARFLRLCGAPRLVDDLVEWVWKILGTGYPGENLHRLDSCASSVRAFFLQHRATLCSSEKCVLPASSCSIVQPSAAPKSVSCLTGRTHFWELQRVARCAGRGRQDTLFGAAESCTMLQKEGTDRGSTAIQAVQIFPWIASAKILECCGFLDTLRTLGGDKIRDAVSGQCKPCSTNRLCGNGDDRTHNNILTQTLI
ncbi:hypothetical protein SUGI_0028970 [Cryptomeria japonica]|nr:hypothetical protein SUGI_0028970 [Cryptomeria japonica]